MDDVVEEIKETELPEGFHEDVPEEELLEVESDADDIFADKKKLADEEEVEEEKDDIDKEIFDYMTDPYEDKTNY